MKMNLPENAVPSKDFYYVDITPELAKKWFSRNYLNRAMRPQVVQEYARYMRDGHWGETDSYIALAPNGSVLNGQHRLAAVITSGVTIRSLVRFNAKYSDFIPDHGHKRTLLDVFRLEFQDGTIRGKEINVLKAAVAGYLCENQDQRCASELIPYFHVYGPRIGELIDRVGEKFDTTALGVLAKASFCLPKAKVDEFCDLLTQKNEKHPATGMVRAYLTWLYLQTNRRKATRREIYKWTQFILKAVADGQTKCKIPSVAIDLFPLCKLKNRA